VIKHGKRPGSRNEFIQSTVQAAAVNSRVGGQERDNPEWHRLYSAGLRASSIRPKRASSLAGDAEIAAVLDTGNRSESNACSGGEGEIAGGEVKPI
jgi:hypothetical protein